MRKFLVTALALFPALAFAAIGSSAHDLTQEFNSATATCYFCHYPHHVQSTRALWRRQTPAAWGWVAGSTTTLGTLLPANVNAASIRCLSCHDGTTSSGTVQYYQTYGSAASAINAFPKNATNPTDFLTANTIFNLANGTINTNVSQNLDSSANGNHPVSIAYPPALGGTNYYGTNTTCVGPGITTCLVNTGNPQGNQVKIDGTQIECTSCHEPHNYYNNTRFLRAGGTICIACHNK